MKIKTKGSKHFGIKPEELEIVGVMASSEDTGDGRKLYGFLLQNEHCKTVTGTKYSILLSDLQVTQEIIDTFTGRGFLFPDRYTNESEVSNGEAEDNNDNRSEEAEDGAGEAEADSTDTEAQQPEAATSVSSLWL